VALLFPFIYLALLAPPARLCHFTPVMTSFGF